MLMLTTRQRHCIKAHMLWGHRLSELELLVSLDLKRNAVYCRAVA